MRRLPTHRDAHPLALDEETVEQLLTGALPPTQAPAGYAKVAQLLAAAAAAPTPEELAGQEAALAELRAVARARPAAAMARVPARPPRRRRRTGLAVVVVVGALVTGGAAGAATGHLPGPVRDAARAITGAEIGTPASPTTGQPSTSAAGTPNASGAGATASRPGGAPGSGPGSTGAGVAAGPAPDPALKGLCLAYAAGEGADRGGKLDATALADLAKAAGGEEQVAAFCEDLLPGDQQLKETKKTKDTKKSEQPNPSATGPQSPPASTSGQGNPPASTESGQSQGTSPSEAGRP